MSGTNPGSAIVVDASVATKWMLADEGDSAAALLVLADFVAGDIDLDWTLHFVDGTVVRAHQHAAGAKKGRRPGARPLPGAAARPNSTSVAGKSS